MATSAPTPAERAAAALKKSQAFERELRKRRQAEREARRTAAVRFATRHGGQEASVVFKMHRTTIWHWQRRTVPAGASAAARLERRAYVLATANATSDTAAALEFGLSRMTLWRWRQALKDDPKLQGMIAAIEASMQSRPPTFDKPYSYWASQGLLES